MIKKGCCKKKTASSMLAWTYTALAILVPFLILMFLAYQFSLHLGTCEDDDILLTKSKKPLFKTSMPISSKLVRDDTISEATLSELFSEIEKQVMHTNIYGYVINRPHTAIIITNKVNDADKPIEERIFANSADQKIAALLLLEPGEMMIGDASSLFGKGFIRSFLRSIETPIVVTDNDDEFTANLKRAVIDTKLELKSRYDEGEDIAQLMLKERNELQALGLYREELKEEIHKLARNKSLSEEAMQDFINAANKMLEERGGKPLEMPRFAARRFLLQQQFKSQNEEE